MLPATGYNQFFVSPVKKVKMALRAFWHSTVDMFVWKLGFIGIALLYSSNDPRQHWTQLQTSSFEYVGITFLLTLFSSLCIAVCWKDCLYMNGMKESVRELQFLCGELSCDLTDSL